MALVIRSSFRRQFTFVSFLAVAGLNSGSHLFAQKTTGTTTGATTGATGTSTGSSLPTVGRTTTNNPSQNNTTPNTSPAMQRPIFLSGKVQISDGSPLPTGITIERVCGANTRPVAYTDSKGRFQFEWNRNNGVLPDASSSATRNMLGGTDASNGMGGMSGMSGGSFGSASESEMMGCELRANAPGYRSDIVNLAGHRAMDNPDVGVIVLRRMGEVEGTSISATSFNAPKDSRKAYDKGIELMHKGKNEDAARNFEKAVGEYDNFADAWYQLGRMRQSASNPDGAREAFLKALSADGKLVGPTVELGLMSLREKKWKEAADYSDRAVRLDPIDFPQAWFASAAAHYSLKDFDAAEKSARQSVKLDPKRRNPRAGYLLGLILAEKQDFPGASAQLREYLKNTPEASDAEVVRKQLDQIEKLASTARPNATRADQQ